MSNINKMNANEQLFTKLTPEEGATISGGLRSPSSSNPADSSNVSDNGTVALESLPETNSNLLSSFADPSDGSNVSNIVTSLPATNSNLLSECT